MANGRASSVLKLVASVLVCQAAGGLGALFTTPAIPTWYATLKKPSFTPPGWVFGPVWTTLYTLMGISLFLIWRKLSQGQDVKTDLGIFGTQLTLNAVWSVVFFGLRSPFAGLVVIVALWLAIVSTIVSFYRNSKTAALILVPYIVWVSIATALNFSIWRLNR